MLLLMLAWNVLTPMMADDFAYAHSFATGERITSVGEIFPSLAAHMESMNGRTPAHFFAQLFLLLLAWIFDAVNSLMFVALLLLLLRLCGADERTRLSMLWGAFAVLILATPDFGQVYLWLDGACNYLWSVVAVLLFLIPYVDAFLRDRRMHSPIQILLFWIVAFLAGAYLENVSGAAILIAGLFWLGLRFYGKKRTDVPLLIGLISAAAGLGTIALSPAQFTNKASAFSLEGMLLTFSIALGVLALLALPLGLFVFLLLRARKCGAERRVTLTALIFFVGAMASNFVMVLAAYYPLRCAVGCTVFLLAGAWILLAHTDHAELFSAPLKAMVRFIAAALLLAVILGSADIAVTHYAIHQNEVLIENAVTAGERTVTLECPVARTKYSGLYNLKYLGIGTQYDWPNDSMAKYFGIEGIIGKQAD